jgi:hypothetical protein
MREKSGYCVSWPWFGFADSTDRRKRNIVIVTLISSSIFFTGVVLLVLYLVGILFQPSSSPSSHSQTLLLVKTMSNTPGPVGALAFDGKGSVYVSMYGQNKDLSGPYAANLITAGCLIYKLAFNSTGYVTTKPTYTATDRQAPLSSGWTQGDHASCGCSTVTQLFYDYTIPAYGNYSTSPLNIHNVSWAPTEGVIGKVFGMAVSQLNELYVSEMENEDIFFTRGGRNYIPKDHLVTGNPATVNYNYRGGFGGNARIGPYGITVDVKYTNQTYLWLYDESWAGEWAAYGLSPMCRDNFGFQANSSFGCPLVCSSCRPLVPSGAQKEDYPWSKLFWQNMGDIGPLGIFGDSPVPSEPNKLQPFYLAAAVPGFVAYPTLNMAAVIAQTITNPSPAMASAVARTIKCYDNRQSGGFPQTDPEIYNQGGSRLWPVHSTDLPYTPGEDLGNLLNAPRGIAFDSIGNLYIANLNCVKIINPSFWYSVVFVGNCTVSGFNNSADGDPLFNRLAGIAVDEHFNLYLADTMNNAIRKVSWTSNQTVTNLYGNINVSTLSSDFLMPEGVVTDGFGGLYVADTGNHVIKHLAQDGTTKIVAGNGTKGFADGTGSAQFSNPSAIARDKNTGVLYVGDDSGVRRVFV